MHQRMKCELRIFDSFGFERFFGIVEHDLEGGVLRILLDLGDGLVETRLDPRILVQRVALRLRVAQRIF